MVMVRVTVPELLALANETDAGFTGDDVESAAHAETEAARRP
jgi:hypothetical protein